VSEAYETLSDPGKKSSWENSQRGFSPNAGFSSGSGHPFDGIFEQMFASGFGSGFSPGFGAGFANRRQRADTNIQLNVSLEDAYTGKTVPIQFTDNLGRSIELVVDVPAGVDNGMIFKYSHPGISSGSHTPTGDLYVTMAVAPHNRFQRDGDNLTTVVDVPLWTYLTGGDVEVVSLPGKIAKLSVPALLNANATLRLRGLGMVNSKSGNTGDLLVKIRPLMPATLTQSQTETIRSWS
jgi:DnaJ-class molecular chaperone